MINKYGNIAYMKTLIIIPAYNEAGNIVKFIGTLRNDYPQYDYVIINDGSEDNTGKICAERGYNVVNLPINLGIGGAVQTGYKYAYKHDYDVAVQMDGDGQHDPQFLDGMLKLIESGQADIVVGSRFVNKEGFQSSATRRTGINILSFLGWIFTGVRLKDITSGYRMVNKHMIKIYANDYPADYPEPEAMVMASVHGCKLVEYPVVMRERESGKSSINLKKSVYYMIKVSLAMFIRRLSLGFRR